jgi:hypothetical protein
VSLREEFGPAGRYFWLPENYRIVKADGIPYSDSELDERRLGL